MTTITKDKDRNRISARDYESGGTLFTLVGTNRAVLTKFEAFCHEVRTPEDTLQYYFAIAIEGFVDDGRFYADEYNSAYAWAPAPAFNDSEYQEEVWDAYYIWAEKTVREMLNAPDAIIVW